MDSNRLKEIEFVPVGAGSGCGRGRGFRAVVPPSRFKTLTGGALPNTSRTEVEDKDGGGDAPTDSAVVRDGNEYLEESQKMFIGTKGTRCHCLTNFVRLNRDEDVKVFEYHVAFSHGLETKLKWKVLIQLTTIIGPVSNFDGQTTLFLPFRMKDDVTVIDCTHPNIQNESVQVTITFTKVKLFLELAPFLNILFRRILLNFGFYEIRRGFYDLADVQEFKDHKLQVWPGVLLTVETKPEGLAVMIDFPSRVLRSETLYDYYKAMKNINGDFKQKFATFAIGKIIICKYSNKCYKIDDIDYNLSPRAEFHYCRQLISYADYFKNQYNVAIEELDQPMVLSKIKPRRYQSNEECVRVVALVPELCYLTGLTEDHRANFKIREELSSIVRQNPAVKLGAMQSLLSRIHKSKEAQKLLKDWGIAMEDSVLGVKARKIDETSLLFKENTSGQVVRPNFSKQSCSSCYNPMDIQKFLVLCPLQENRRARDFLSYYKLACTTVGIRMSTNGEIICVAGHTPAAYIKELECFVTSEVQFVIIIMPTHRDDVYVAVKKFCLATFPIPSQCILSKTLNPHTIKTAVMKICLQINCKLGGSLWALKMPFAKRIMFIGMDAAHDQTRKNPSVIALVASMNDTCTKYFSRCNFLPIHQEVSTTLRIMFMDALNAYKTSNDDLLPSHIIFYRDGGWAGTFEVLKKYEVDTCIEVLQEMCTDRESRPKFSYVCVAKRIPERLLLSIEGGHVINPESGTVLDHGITQPHLYDFYLVSQNVRQGTLSPTHYTVLHETKFTTPDVMQKLTYGTTYMYYNYQGCVKVPALIQYAHKLGQLVSRVKVAPNRRMSNHLYFL